MFSGDKGKGLGCFGLSAVSSSQSKDHFDFAGALNRILQLCWFYGADWGLQWLRTPSKVASFFSLPSVAVWMVCCGIRSASDPTWWCCSSRYGIVWLWLLPWPRGRRLQCRAGRPWQSSLKNKRRGGKDQIHGISKYSTNHQETNWMATKRFLSRVLYS